MLRLCSCIGCVSAIPKMSMRKSSIPQKTIVLFWVFSLVVTRWSSAQNFGDFLKKANKAANDVKRATQAVDNALRPASQKQTNVPRQTQPMSSPQMRNAPVMNNPNAVRRSNFVDQENELFYCFGKQSTHYVYTPEELEEKTRRNVLTPDKDENMFLHKFFVFTINNKRSNKQLFKCDERTLTIKVFEREASGLAKKVVAYYQYLDNTNTLLPDKYEIQTFFEEGIPYYVWFPAYEAHPTYPHHQGVIGSLIYSDSHIAKMVRLNDRDALARRNNRIKTINPQINDSLSRLLVKKFPGVDCSSCLSRTVKQQQMEKVTEFVNGYGEKSYKKDYYTDYHIKIENKCGKALKVVGISQGYEKGQQTFGFVWRTFTPKQVIQFTRSSDDLVGGMIGSLLSGKGEVEDIDLSKINKKYDVENGGEIQFLRIIEVK